LARAQLKDTNNDGYLNWVWLNDPNIPLYYNKDIHDMDEMLTHSMVAQVAYALKSNAQFDPVYGEHAAFWTDYLLKDFLPKWQARGGLDKSLAHPYAHFMRFYYYLYRLTDDEKYLDEAFRRARVLDNMMKHKVVNHEIAFVWDHRVPGMGDPPYGCQETGYGIFTVLAFQDLSMEGFGKYADPEYMRHYTITFRDLVLTHGTDALAGTVCGDGEESFGKYSISSIPGLAVWDDSGKILGFSAEAFQLLDNPGQPQRIFIPAYMVYALVESPLGRAATLP
jgi:hypothetical protein